MKVPFEIKKWTTLIKRMVEKVAKIFQLVQEPSKIFSLTIVIKLKKKKRTNDLHLANPQSSPKQLSPTLHKHIKCQCPHQFISTNHVKFNKLTLGNLEESGGFTLEEP